MFNYFIDRGTQGLEFRAWRSAGHDFSVFLSRLSSEPMPVYTSKP